MTKAKLFNLENHQIFNLCFWRLVGLEFFQSNHGGFVEIFSPQVIHSVLDLCESKSLAWSQNVVKRAASQVRQAEAIGQGQRKPNHSPVCETNKEPALS